MTLKNMTLMLSLFFFVACSSSKSTNSTSSMATQGAAATEEVEVKETTLKQAVPAVLEATIIREPDDVIEVDQTLPELNQPVQLTPEQEKRARERLEKARKKG